MHSEKRGRALLFDGVAISFSIFQVCYATFGRLDPFLLRIIHLYFALLLVFLALPTEDKKPITYKVINNIFLLLVILTGSYLISTWSTLTERFPLISDLPEGGLIFGIIFSLILLEAVRRYMGKEVVILLILISLYVLFGALTPGIFRHFGYSFDNIIDVVYLSTEGTFGETLGISANYLYLYILLGSLLMESGIGELFIQMATSLVGHLTGGAAKVATITCAAFGMVQGSAVAGVLTIGTITIPLMKRAGYPAYLAGAIIAVVASGDILMPPVMGAIAFMMAQYLGMPYSKIIIYAFLPAIIYFFTVFSVAHFDAKKRRLPIIPKKELPPFFPILKKGWYLWIPVILLIGLLINQYSLKFAVLFPIYSIMAIMLLHPGKGLRSRFFDVVMAFRDGAKNALLVVIALAAANLIEGLISITGLALKLSSILVYVSPNIYVLLGLAAVTLFLLGLALPSFIIYVTAVPIMVPPMVAFGLDPVAVHLFLIYWAVLSMITPPTGTSFYVAAGVASAPVMKVGWTATRIAAPIYILTFAFALHPAILLRGSNLWETLYYFIPAILGVISISAANAGYFLSDLSFIQKVVLIVSGILLIYGHPFALLFGGLAFTGVLLLQVMQKKSPIKISILE